MIFTLLPIYYITKVGLNPFQLVLVGTALEGTILLFEIPTGIVADTFSRRLSVIVGTLLLGLGLMLESALPTVAAVFMGEVVRGFGHTFTSGAMDAWLAGEVGETEVGKVYLRGAQVEQGASLVGIIGSVVLASWGLQVPLLTGAGLIVATGLFLIGTMPETHFEPAPHDGTNAWKAMVSTTRSGLGAIRRRPVLITFVLIAIFGGMSSEGYDRLWEAHLLQNISLPPLGGLQSPSWFGIIAAGSALLSIPVTETIQRRLNQSREKAVALVLVICALLQAACMVGFALSGQLIPALLCHWTVSVCRGVAAPLRSSWLVRSVEPRVRATVLSMVGQADAIGQTAFGPAIGWLGTVRGLRMAIGVAGVILTPAIPLFARAGKQGTQESMPCDVHSEG